MKHWVNHPVIFALTLAGLSVALYALAPSDPIGNLLGPGARHPLYLAAGGLLGASFAGSITAVSIIFGLSERGRAAAVVRFQGTALLRGLAGDLVVILTAALVATGCVAFDTASEPSGARYVLSAAVVAGVAAIFHLGYVLLIVLGMELEDRHGVGSRQNGLT